MMRILIINACVLLGAITVVQPLGDSVTFTEPVSAKYGSFLDHEDNRENLLNLMNDQMDLSMKYLLTSKQFGSQFVQRPGLAKYLDEASTRHWDEGMDLLKKYLQRGGSINNDEFKNAMKVSGKPQLQLTGEENLVDKYVKTLDTMRTDSLALAKSMNHLHHVAGRKYLNGGDAEIAHYFDGKLEKEAEVTRELARHVNNLNVMKGSGIAVNMFDSNF